MLVIEKKSKNNNRNKNKNKNENKNKLCSTATKRDSPEWRGSWGLYGLGGWEASASSQTSLDA